MGAGQSTDVKVQGATATAVVSPRHISARAADLDKYGGEMSRNRIPHVGGYQRLWSKPEFRCSLQLTRVKLSFFSSGKKEKNGCASPSHGGVAPLAPRRSGVSSPMSLPRMPCLIISFRVCCPVPSLPLPRCYRRGSPCYQARRLIQEGHGLARGKRSPGYHTVSGDRCSTCNSTRRIESNSHICVCLYAM